MVMAGILKYLILAFFVSSLNAFDTIQLPALGRPFGLGDLYNLKEGRVIIGPKLWTWDHLKDYSEKIQRKTNFEIIASNDIVDLHRKFDIDDWLSLEYLGGLIKLSGSAAFLDDRIKTSNTARVSLKFDARTFIIVSLDLEFRKKISLIIFV